MVSSFYGFTVYSNHKNNTNYIGTLQMKQIRNIIFLLTFLGAASPVSALPITYGGLDYNITTITGTISEHVSLLEAQDWFGDYGLARNLADAVGSSFGLNPGPLFAVYSGGYVDGYVHSNGLTNYALVHGSEDFTFAVAAAAVPEPSTIALFAAGFFGIAFARRRRS